MDGAHGPPVSKEELNAYDMARHVVSFHLDLGQLWRCPVSVSWFTQWKGTPRECMDHVRAKHHVNDSVKTASMGKWFPPWTVTRTAWKAAFKPKVSGISTDAALFREHEAQLVNHYRVLGDCVAHAALRGQFMIYLLYLTNRPAPILVGRPNVAGARGPVPVRHRITAAKTIATHGPVRTIPARQTSPEGNRSGATHTSDKWTTSIFKTWIIICGQNDLECDL